MVRNYIRKTTRQQWDANSMQLALNEISNGIPFKRAARIYNLPLSTLKRRAKDQNKLAKGHSKQLGAFTTTLPTELEAYLKQYILEMEDRLFGLTKKNVCEMAYQLAERNGLNHRFSKAKKAAGTAWFRDFLKRNPEISFRTPEATSAARARGFNRESVTKYFSILEEIITKHDIGPMRTYNMDESGIQTVPSKLPKILAHKGRKQVGFLTSAERGQNVSVVLCVNATGQFIPPAIIFPRKRRNDLLYQGVPYGTLCLYNESGYMKSDTFIQFLQHFKQHTQCSIENKVLLLLDGHSSHKSVEAIEYCRENGIILLSFPPHCTHEMQPLDVAVFSPLMTYFNEEAILWLKANPGKVITLYNIGALFGKAFRRAATLNNGLSAFEKTGIFPFNPNIFPDWKYKPSCTTDRPLETNDAMGSSRHEEKTPFPQKDTSSLPSTSGVHLPKRKRRLRDASSSDESEDWEASGRSSDEVSVFAEYGEDTAQGLSNMVPEGASLNPKLGASSPDVHISDDAPKSGAQQLNITLEKSTLVTPFEIMPLPIAPIQTRSSRPSQGATIFTSTPNYLLLKEKSRTPRPAAKPAKKAVSRKIFTKGTEKKNKLDEDDPACIFCLELFSASQSKEIWIKCNLCHKWAHALCAGAPKKQKVYICDFCR